jgi:peptide chain release factor subunit 3
MLSLPSSPSLCLSFSYLFSLSPFQGKTVEVGRARFATTNKRYTLLDAPGHRQYVPNMIGGTSQADIGVLVISARTGEFETGFDRGGQTREHAMLAKTLVLRSLLYSSLFCSTHSLFVSLSLFLWSLSRV